MTSRASWRDDARREADRVIAQRSPLAFRFFAGIFARDIARSFHAVRLLGNVPSVADRPVVVVSNHPSWWDAALFTWLASTLFAGRRCFAPIDARMLTRYPFFGRIGAFGVESGSLSSSSHFLALSERLLRERDGLLLVNGEGHFRDARVRPLHIAPGIAHLVRRAPDALFLPLAIEYTFWDERRPNALLHFGAPVAAHTLAGLSMMEVRSQIGDAIAAALETLATAAMTRDPRSFQTLLTGKTGINRVYDAWRFSKAKLTGRRFSPAHGDQA